AECQLRRMLGVARHEAFYKTGTWVDEASGVYVGWTVRDGSFAGEAPLCNERGDVTLIFSGEDFPEPGTAARLTARGHRFDPDGPSYLVHTYEEDAAFPATLNGRFHGLVSDRSSGTVTLFNDRYGMHRLYIHESKEAFYFAAAAKPILAVRPELRSVHTRSLGESMALGCVLENRALFEGIRQLPGASRWVFKNGSLAGRAAYFDPREWEEQPPIGPEEYYEQLRDVFSRNLPRYFNGPERIGMSLTGGLDTRMIMAWRKSPPRAPPCYTFRGQFREGPGVVAARPV